jgi:hypothetical protein
MTPIDTPAEFRYLLEETANEEASALERLFAASALRQGLDELLTELAQVAREEEGFSWADVGKVLDITKQAAQQRFGKPGVITVSPEGNVSVSTNRKKYEESMREALRELEGKGLPKDYKPQLVEVEVEVEVPVPVPAKKKAKPAKKKGKA